MKRVLITGGAGFIGSHLADELLSHGYDVRLLDNLSPQVHGEGGQRPEYLHPDAELLVGDVRSERALRSALKDVDAVFHFAAAVGVGQSMYEIARYTEVNNVGTAMLLEVLEGHPLERLIVASSMSIYGEGLYETIGGESVEDAGRTPDDLRRGRWDPVDGNGRPLQPRATPETKRPSLSSIYALSKYDQERMCLMMGRARGVPTVALRFFNVFGPRQALSNPYTGVLAIFASRLLNERAPLVFEDGLQKRDFVSVYDVARACRLALERPGVADRVLNIGSGRQYTVREVAERLAGVLGRSAIEPEITGKHRVGDIRHCFADIGRAREVLGYRPQVAFEDGLLELAEWLRDQAAEDRAELANAELAARGLTV